MLRDSKFVAGKTTQVCRRTCDTGLSRGFSKLLVGAVWQSCLIMIFPCDTLRTSCEPAPLSVRWLDVSGLRFRRRPRSPRSGQSGRVIRRRCCRCKVFQHNACGGTRRYCRWHPLVEQPPCRRCSSTLWTNPSVDVPNRDYSADRNVAVADKLPSGFGDRRRGSTLVDADRIGRSVVGVRQRHGTFGVRSSSAQCLGHAPPRRSAADRPVGSKPSLRPARSATTPFPEENPRSIPKDSHCQPVAARGVPSGQKPDAWPPECCSGQHAPSANVGKSRSAERPRCTHQRLATSKRVCSLRPGIRKHRFASPGGDVRHAELVDMALHREVASAALSAIPPRANAAEWCACRAIRHVDLEDPAESFPHPNAGGHAAVGTRRGRFSHRSRAEHHIADSWDESPWLPLVQSGRTGVAPFVTKPKGHWPLPADYSGFASGQKNLLPDGDRNSAGHSHLREPLAGTSLKHREPRKKPMIKPTNSKR